MLMKQRNHARMSKNIFRFVVDSWFSFQAYCQNHCSILIENFSSRDASAISYFIQSQLRGENFWKVTCDRTMFSNKITWALIHSRKKMQIKKKNHHTNDRTSKYYMLDDCICDVLLLFSVKCCFFLLLSYSRHNKFAMIIC